MFEVYEVVVIALEQVSGAGAPDNPVQHDRTEHLVVVGDDLTDVVAALAAHERQVARVEARLHADPVGDDVGRGAAEADRGEVEPQTPQNEQS
jgi:hypothetical protein